MLCVDLTEPATQPENVWVAVNTHANREALAEEHLSRQLFHVYCPRLKKRVSHARRTSDVLRPLFPGYLFARISADFSESRPIRSTLGVRNIVSCGNKMSCVSETFISALKAREVDGVVARAATAFSVGQEIRIGGGPFDGLVGTIIEMRENDRLTVLMELLNGQVRVNIESGLHAPVKLDTHTAAERR